jgi:hypothetical protein
MMETVGSAEAETERSPLSRRKLGSTYLVLVPSRNGPRLFAGEAFNVECATNRIFPW